MVFFWDKLGFPRTRKLVHMSDLGTGTQYRVHSGDVRTAVRGILERVFYHWEVVDGVKTMRRPYRPSPQVVNAKLRISRNRLLSHTYAVRPFSRAEFLAPLGGSKLARYTKAADDYELRDITYRDAYMQTFIKAEKLNVSAKPDPDPRVIQPRTALYCYGVGRYIKACEKMLYRAVDRLFDGKTVMKGLNADQRGAAFHAAWGKYVVPAAIGIDASRFDMHVCRSLLEFEHSIYNSIYRSAELKKLLKMQLRNKGFVRTDDGWVKYTVDGSRMSGDMNTSLGNVILMCLMVHAYLLTKPVDFSLLNDGDDCVLIGESANMHYLEDLPEYFADLGMIMKVEPVVHELEAVEFCQAHPVEVQPGTWRMVRDPRVTLSKDLCCVKPIQTEKQYDLQRHSVSQCGLSLAGDVPVFNEFYAALGRNAEPSQRALKRKAARGLETGMEFLAVGMSPKFCKPSDCCRLSFAKAFDIWPDTQLAMEQELRSKVVEWKKPHHVSHVVNVFDLTTW